MSTDYGCYTVVTLAPEVLEQEFPAEWRRLLGAYGGNCDEGLFRVLGSLEESDVPKNLEEIAAAMQALSEAFGRKYPGLHLYATCIDDNMSTSPDAANGGYFCVDGAYGWTTAAGALGSKLCLQDVVWYG